MKFVDDDDDDDESNRTKGNKTPSETEKWMVEC